MAKRSEKGKGFNHERICNHGGVYDAKASGRSINDKVNTLGYNSLRWNGIKQKVFRQRNNVNTYGGQPKFNFTNPHN